jgi:hypothetical protein
MDTAEALESHMVDLDKIIADQGFRRHAVVTERLWRHFIETLRLSGQYIASLLHFS